MGLPAPLLQAIAGLGFETPTPVQEQVIPALLKGESDLVALAQTGTGKTAAFGLPLLSLIDTYQGITQALVLCPTRELCMQITRDIQQYGKHVQGLRVTAVYGGASIQNQIKELNRGSQIIVATPGRMIDLLSRKTVIDLSLIKYVVLDEADEMLNMGFKEDIDNILATTPPYKQTWLFSATMPDEVARIAKHYMKSPVEITTGGRNKGNENIEHLYYTVHARDKYAALKRIADFQPDIFAIVFCRTRIETQQIAEAMIKDGYNADALHGDLSQAQRDHVMGRYRNRTIRMLVATDVAARGIDVDNVTHVINYSLPDEIENYTHRSGRTARAGKKGVSISIIHMREVGKIRAIEKKIGRKFTQLPVPNGYEVCERQLFSLVKRVHDVAVNEEEILPYMDSIYEQMADLSKEEIIKRFVSTEFNRFLDYYRNAPDLNSNTQRDGDGGGRDSRGPRRDSNPNAVKFFVNLGQMDDLDKRAMVTLLAVAGDVPEKSIVWVDVRKNYTFVEVETDKADRFLKMASDGHTFKKRKVVVEKRGSERREFSRAGDAGKERRRESTREKRSDSTRERRPKTGRKNKGNRW
jgi:ATP-dependent RNA helicase DeaD